MEKETKAYKIELLIIDHDKLGEEEIASVLENTKYPNWCISPNVKSSKCAEIGEWHDDHPLNKTDDPKNYYEKLFF